MTNNNQEEKEIKSAQNETIEPVKKTVTNPPSPIKSTAQLFFNAMTFIVATIALTSTFYVFYHHQELQKKLNQNRTLLNEQLNQIKQDQATTREQTELLKKTQSQLQEQFGRLHQQLETTLNQQRYENQDWLLLKARHYLELAEINTHWGDSYNASIALLQESDHILKEMNTPKIFDIRQAIAKDIDQLKSIPAIDMAGLLSQLDAAQARVSELTIQSAGDESELEGENKAPTLSNTPAWRSRLQDSIHLLEKLVVIRHDNEEIKPFMSPWLESIIKENIRLNLEEAQWAILNRNPVIYQLAINQAITHLKRTFGSKSPDAAALIKQLHQLQVTKIIQNKPISSGALTLLNQLIVNKEQLNKHMDKIHHGEDL